MDFIGGQGEYGRESKVNPTLRACGQGAIATAYGVTSKGNGDSFISKERHPALSTGGGMPGQGYPAAMYPICGAGLNNSQISNALIAAMHGAVGTTQDNLIVTDYSDAENYIVRRLTPTECARLQGFPDKWGHLQPKNEITEEELLFWKDVRNTHAAINGRTVRDYSEKQMLAWYNKLHTDSAEYKMWGNGIALPTALYCMQGMAEALNGERNSR